MTLTANHKQQQVPPFPLLAGESLLHHETTNEYQIFLTNYRFFVKNIPHKHRSTIISQVPPTSSSSSMITMNGGTSAVSYQNGLNGHVTIMNNNNKSVQQWHKRLCDIQQIDIKHLFCFQFYRELFATTMANNNNNNTIVNNNHQTTTTTNR
ncbi:hypothetical protein DERP_012365 [Dermatophagoides pteronyssinus]|uniref:Uncharacterized protein n=1 Tax=Dermatophagoides pteronyssinus TaxID=6956 RepID=A0ABQ8IUI9_DERPT|nr:hypothetical protein DERP_012365 [Dermatophagoides pteronyssinus]